MPSILFVTTFGRVPYENLMPFGIVPNSDDGYLAYGTGLQGAGFLSLTPHLGALPPSHQDAPGKTLPTVNSNGSLKDVKWDDPLRGTISRHIICSGQLFAQFFRSHPEELPEAQRGQLQAQEAVRRLILSVPGPELV